MLKLIADKTRTVESLRLVKAFSLINDQSVRETVLKLTEICAQHELSALDQPNSPKNISKLRLLFLLSKSLFLE